MGKTIIMIRIALLVEERLRNKSSPEEEGYLKGLVTCFNRGVLKGQGADMYSIID